MPPCTRHGDRVLRLIYTIWNEIQRVQARALEVERRLEREALLHGHAASRDIVRFLARNGTAVADEA
jgi:hypothetical protein